MTDKELARRLDIKRIADKEAAWKRKTAAIKPKEPDWFSGGISTTDGGTWWPKWTSSTEPITITGTSEPIKITGTFEPPTAGWSFGGGIVTGGVAIGSGWSGGTTSGTFSWPTWTYEIEVFTDEQKEMIQAAILEQVLHFSVL